MHFLLFVVIYTHSLYFITHTPLYMKSREALPLQEDLSPKNTELARTIEDVRRSLGVFSEKLKAIFGEGEMSPEQKKLSDAFLHRKEAILRELEEMHASIHISGREIQEIHRQHKTLDAYVSQGDEMLPDEVRTHFDDIQKRLLELNEEQDIILKNFRLIA